MFKDASPAGRRYILRFLTPMAVYALVFFVAAPVSRTTASVAVRVAIALVLAGAVIAAIAAIGRYLVEEEDEYLRMRVAQAVIMATGLTLSVCTLWGYLAAVRVVPDLSTVNIFPMFSAAWLAVVTLRRLMGR